MSKLVVKYASCVLTLNRGIDRLTCAARSILLSDRLAFGSTVYCCLVAIALLLARTMPDIANNLCTKWNSLSGYSRLWLITLPTPIIYEAYWDMINVMYVRFIAAVNLMSSDSIVCLCIDVLSDTVIEQIKLICL